jgi:hypothetical protein
VQQANKNQRQPFEQRNRRQRRQTDPQFDQAESAETRVQAFS